MVDDILVLTHEGTYLYCMYHRLCAYYYTVEFVFVFVVNVSGEYFGLQTNSVRVNKIDHGDISGVVSEFCVV